MKLSPNRFLIPRCRCAGKARPALLIFIALACLVIGGVTVFFLTQLQAQRAALEPVADGSLSGASRSVIESLSEPVEIRYYALLDADSVDSATRAFAKRVDDLMTRFEEAGDGRLRVVRLQSVEEHSDEAARAGLEPFNIHLGSSCYLGIVVTRDGKRVVLAQLAPEWEFALEADVSRAIARVDALAKRASAPAVSTVATAASNPAVMEEVRRLLPNLDELTLDQGRNRLRAAALEEFRTVTSEFESQRQAVQQRLAQARQDSSEAEERAALQELQELQRQHSARLKEIADRSQAQIGALERLKDAR